MNGCISCPYGPGNFEEYAIAQNNPAAYCPDAYSEKAKKCGLYKSDLSNINFTVYHKTKEST